MTNRSDDPDRTARPDPDRKAAAETERAARRAARQAERAAHKAQRQAERQALRAAAQANAADRAAPHAGPAAEAGSPASTPPPARASAPPTPRPTEERPRPTPFDILIVAQGGGIDRQAALLAASLRRNAPGFPGRLIVAEPQPEAAWAGHATRMSDPSRAALTAFGAEIRPLVARDFGASYPHGNKIEALGVLDPGRPFLFLDSDTLILGDIGAVPFGFARPAASMRRSGTWPSPPLYGPGHHDIWASLYDRFGLDIGPTLDRTQPDEHWERFLYFNAGWFFGADPALFGQRFRDWAVAVRDDPGEALACQSLDPWLDQIVLPLVIHSLGGGRPGPELAGMDGTVTCHWRRLSLLYARESDRAVAEIEALAALPEIAPLIDGWEAGERLIRAGLGRSRIRPMFAGARPHPPERAIRKRMRAEGLWLA